MDRIKFATVWLGGCSGCHMSFLDLDEWLVDLSGKIELVYSPIMDIKTYPLNVDVVLVEGAIANEENLELIHRIRRNTRIVISFGDCAVTGNVTAMRNFLGTSEHVLRRAYLEAADIQGQIPAEEGVIPRLLDRVMPVHEAIPVEYYLPGCPPDADRIRTLLEQILSTGQVTLTGQNIKFG